MKRNRSPIGYRVGALLALATAFIVFALGSVSSPAQSNSQARIVRLSFVEGTVTMYRPGVDEWAHAFVNTPIQQGFKVATDANSFAEVEFENGSTARLGQSSELDFTNLSLSPSGGKINRLTLARGYATFTVKPERSDVYQIRAAGSSYDAKARTMFRLDLDENSERLEVFKGNVEVQSQYGSGTVAKSQVLELMPGNANPFQVTNGITEDAWDRWVMKRQQTETVAISKAGAGSPAGSSLYGWNDLSYFGAWNNLPGYGSCWSPTMGAGWSPYSIGRWSWYPGFGYTWISGLPWGWLPFHYGSWIYPAGYGWCWLPGNLSYWSPALVTWYQGPNWIGWAPMPYSGGSGAPARCLGGQNCSTAVSFNSFQTGKPILPNDVLGVNPRRGRPVSSPTVPLTRSLRLPGPAIMGSPFSSINETNANSAVRTRRIGAAPSRVFARGSISGEWNIRPHAPAVYNRRAGPNNDMLLHSRAMRGRAGGARDRLTSIPISDLAVHNGAVRHANSLAPSARTLASPAGIRPFQKIRSSDFRHGKFSRRNRSTGNSMWRRQMRMHRRVRMSQRRFQRPTAPRRASGSFGGNRSMRTSQQSMGGMRGGMGGGMRGGMRGENHGSHGPHR